MVWKNKKPLEFIIKETQESLRTIKEDIGPASASLSEVIARLKMGELKVKLKECEYYTSAAFVEIEKYLDLFDSIDTEYRTEVLDKLDILESENIKLKETIRLLEEALKTKDTKIETLEAEVLEKKDIVKRLDKVDSLLDTVEDNVKALAVSKRAKDATIDKGGKNSPKYKDVDNKLKEDYKNGKKDENGNQILDENGKVVRYTLNELAEKYNLTVPGVRYKLQSLGVYEPVYNKKQ